MLHLPSMLLEASEAISGTAEKAFKSGYPNLAENASTSERLIYGLKVCGLGMLIVFGVLIALAAVLYLFKLYYVVSSKKSSQKADFSVKAANNDDSAEDNGEVYIVEDDEELIAAIATAAIATVRNESDAAFKVTSIKRISGEAVNQSEDLVVALATAAIAASQNSSDVTFKVKSVRKIA